MKMNGIQLIAAERTRQMEDEGWSNEHDDAHDIGQLADAAICYITAGSCLANGPVMMGPDYHCTPENLLENFKDDKFGGGVSWPWDYEWLKISPNPIRSYVKAGALLAAEIERLLRIESAKVDRNVSAVLKVWPDAVCVPVGQTFHVLQDTGGLQSIGQGATSAEAWANAFSGLGSQS